MAEANRGATIKEWTFASYEMHERGRSWFVAASVVAAILLIYAFFTKNFLFAVILVMVAVVLYLQKSRAPEQLSCAITEQGIVLHDRFTAYEDLKDFWVVDEAGPRQKHPRDGRRQRRQRFQSRARARGPHARLRAFGRTHGEAVAGAGQAA